MWTQVCMGGRGVFFIYKVTSAFEVCCHLSFVLGITLLVANRYLSFPPKLEENSRSYMSYPGNTYT